MKTFTIEAHPDFVEKCEADGVAPQDVLAAFIRDLCGLPGSSGSDERDLAQRYYLRCGYGWER